MERRKPDLNSNHTEMTKQPMMPLINPLKIEQSKYVLPPIKSTSQRFAKTGNTNLNESYHEFDVDEKNRGSSTIINENEHNDK